jgi:anti-anti-sigma factor
MSVQIQQREHKGIVILDLNGPLILGKHTSDFESSLQILNQSGKTGIALNLRNAGRIDSTGIGTLVVALMRLRKAGGRLALFNVSPSHMNLLRLSKLAKVFEVFADEQGALDSFSPDRAILEFPFRHPSVT